MKRLFFPVLAILSFLAASCTTKTPPIADFSAAPVSGDAPLLVQFTDKSAGNPTSWKWEFGDGSISTEQNPAYTYDSTGSYDVILVVTNADGTDSLLVHDYIAVGQPLYQKFDTLGITFQWRTTSDSIYVKLSAHTTGWLAAGFDPEPGQKMLHANQIIGYVSAGAVHIEDDYANQQTSHVSDVSLGGQDNVSDKQGSELAGTTEITFTFPLNSGDQYDKVLVPGDTHTVILAHGADGVDDFATWHGSTTRARKQIKL